MKPDRESIIVGVVDGISIHALPLKEVTGRFLEQKLQLFILDGVTVQSVQKSYSLNWSGKIFHTNQFTTVYGPNK